MDKKLLSKLFLFSLSGALLVGCGNQTEDTPEEGEEPDTEVTDAPEEETTDTEETTDQVTFTIDIVVDDEAVIKASNTGEPVALSPTSKASIAYRNIARRILGENVPLQSLEDEKSVLQKFKSLFSKK